MGHLSSSLVQPSEKNNKAAGPLGNGAAALMMIFSMLSGKTASPCLSQEFQQSSRFRAVMST
jgi:hypothetical protein